MSGRITEREGRPMAGMRAAGAGLGLRWMAVGHGVQVLVGECCGLLVVEELPAHSSANSVPKT